MPPPVAYARNLNGEHIAYQVIGQGDPAIVFIPDWVTNLDLMWEEPTLARFLDRLSAFSTLICFDKRGTGLSDPVDLSALPTYEEWTDDVGTVLDAVGVEHSAVFGHGDGGHMAIRFAAMHPQRVASLVLMDAYARRRRAPEYPWGVPDELVAAYVETIVTAWASGSIAGSGGAPTLADNPHFVAWRGRYERGAMPPGRFSRIYPTTYDTDVRSALPLIQAPTLILHRRDNRYIRVDNGRYLAEHIEGARFEAIDGADHFFHAGNIEAALGHVQSFVTGTTEVPEEHRVLATVLFTDIVDATRLAQQHGDRAWAELLARHHDIVRRELERFRGREVDNAGDGFFATFDGPGKAVRCALSLTEAMAALGLEIRAGLHTGECELIGPKIGGIAVHICARVMALAEPGQVLVSRTVKDLVVGSGLRFSALGERSLKGVQGTWELYAAGS